MSNAMQVVAHRQYAPKVLYTPCPTSAISSVFDVPEGYHAQLQLYALPTGWCVTLEEEVCLCCCDLEYYPVCNDCGHDITLGFTQNDHQTLCLSSGKYRATVSDEDGDPVTPAAREVVIKVSIMPGPCPATV